MNTDDRPVVLVVDDEPNIASFLAENFASDDFDVHVARSIAQARSKLNSCEADVVVLDVGLPDGNGLDFCREIREADPMFIRFDPNVPVVMLTARTEDVDRVRGFERGADDYVPKPFHYPELLARVRAVIRRTRHATAREIVRAAGINLDLTTREVYVGETKVPLSSKEFLLLAALAREPRRVYRKQELLECVWGFRSSGSTRTLDSHVSRLRKKLRAVASDYDYVSNVWGIGYRLVAIEDRA